MADSLKVGTELFDYAMRISLFCDDLEQAQTFADKFYESIDDTYDGKAYDEITTYHQSLSSHIARLKTLYMTARTYITQTQEWMENVDAEIASTWFADNPGVY